METRDARAQPILNALVNTGAGATRESAHHGVGIGYSIHAGMVVVAGATPDAGHRLQRVLTTDPSCATPMPATRRRSRRPRRHGLKRPGVSGRE